MVKTWKSDYACVFKFTPPAVLQSTRQQPPFEAPRADASLLSLQAYAETQCQTDTEFETQPRRCS